MADVVQIEHSTLRSLHRIHTELADLNDRIKRGPRQIAASEAAVKQTSVQLDEARDTLKRAKMASDAKQLQLKEREQRVKDLEGKLNTAATNREFQTIKEQIAADEQANGVLSDEILESFETVEELGKVVQEWEAQLKAKESDKAKLSADIADRLTDLQEKLDRVTAELLETEKKLPSSIRDQYKRLISHSGEDGLAPIDGESCSGCGVTISPQMMNRLLLSQLVTCPSCAALLYTPEDRAAV